MRLAPSARIRAARSDSRRCPGKCHSPTVGISRHGLSALASASHRLDSWASAFVLGAGFAGPELATKLSETFGEDAGVTLIDQAEAFVFGYSKLDVMFGRVRLEDVRLPYSAFAKPGVRFLRKAITAIDPDGRRVVTNSGVHEADVLVVALGADYDFEATPGLEEGGHEFHLVAGVAASRPASDVHPRPCSGRRLRRAVQVPARAERGGAAPARLPVRARSAEGLRQHARDAVRHAHAAVPDTSAALLEAFAERGIDFVGGRRVAAFDATRHVAVLEDGDELVRPLPRGAEARAPRVVLESGIAVDGYIPVESRTLQTRIPGIYALGDVATIGVPKAGVFSEGAARVVAETIIACRAGGEPPEGYDGRLLRRVRRRARSVSHRRSSSPTSRTGASRRLRWFSRTEPGRRA